MTVTRNQAINEERKRSYLTLVKKGERSKTETARNLIFWTLKMAEMVSARMTLSLKPKLQLQHHPRRGDP